MEPLSAYLLGYLQDLARDPRQAELDLGRLPPEYQQVGQEMQRLALQMAQLSDLAQDLARGNLDIPLPPPDNRLADPLKALHASLRHLTWQTQQVAKGDYRQRVDFMGDFARAFNTMIQQLERRRAGLLTEIEDWQQKNRLLLQNTSMYEMLVGQIEQWIVVVDADTGHWLFASRETGEMLDNPRGREELCRWMQEQTDAMRGQSGMVVAQVKLPRAQGEYVFSISIHPMHWNRRNALAFVLTDVSSEQEKLELLQGIAHHDSLTQVYSRYYGMEKLEQWVGQHRDFVLCFVDMNHLKRVNDRYGHPEGDRYIIRVADQLRRFSQDAMVCRTGGDEFMLLAEGWTMEQARQRIQWIQQQLREAGRQDGTAYDNSISYGIVWVGKENTHTSEELLREVDERMYRNKRGDKKHLQPPCQGEGQP